VAHSCVILWATSSGSSLRKARKRFLDAGRVAESISPYPLAVNEQHNKKVKGVTRAEIKEALKLKEGGELTTALKNLQKCDFIRMYSAYGKKEREMMYQLTDLYTLYYLRFVKAGNSQDRSDRMVDAAVNGGMVGLLRSFER
jgi:hypothetical protein